MDKQDWQRLSPLLDELLDASESARARRLKELRDADDAAAEDLHKLLAGLADVDAGFLEQPAPLPFAGAEGELVGAYRLECLLGQGGMGVVWLASRADGRFEGLVAIKFVNLALMSPGGVERFAREGRILARLSHPNIARLIDAGVDAHRRPYLLLEYVDGQPIDRHCERRELDVRARLALFLEVLVAVAHAHTRLILHRDVKPGNILVDAAGGVKLLDFGIAKLLDADEIGEASLRTEAGEHAFTPAYAAPEQVLGQRASTATDVYALGVLLYELLGGGHPTKGAATSASPLAALRAVAEATPRKLSDAILAGAPTTGADRAPMLRRVRAVRGDLDNIVAKALRKAPAERYANAAEFAADIRRHLRDEPVIARPETMPYIAAKFVRRHRLGVTMATLVALSLAFAAVYSAWQARRVERQRQRAETLVEFMLGDLRKKLQPVGRLDALDGVGAEVLAYYDTPDQAAQADADSLGRRARALHLIGEIREKRGHLDEARAAFEEAARTTRTLLDRAPTDASRLFDHAQSAFWLGHIERALGRGDRAAAALQDYLALARRLVALDPARAEWQMEVAYASEGLGVVQLEQGHPEEALRSLAVARDVQQALEPAHPDQRIELARTYGWISDAQLTRADLGAALQAQRDKLAVLDRVPQGSDDRQVQENRAIVLAAIGALERMVGDLASARASLEDASRRYEALVALDPTNMQWLINLGIVRVRHAELLFELGDRRQASELLSVADGELQRSQAGAKGESPRHLAFAARAQLVHARLADGAALGRAIAETQASLEHIGDFSLAGHPPDNEQRQITAELEQQLAAMLARAGRPTDAHRKWEQVLRETQGDVASLTLPMQVARAQALHGLDRREDAEVLVRRLLQSACRLPELTRLVDELAHELGGANASP